jgi:hypothetical protein
MKKILILVLWLLPIYVFCQEENKPKKEKNNKQDNRMRIGIKGGLNFANVTKASSINSSSRTGFMAGVFLAPPSTGILAYRTELIFSRQGYDYKSNTATGTVDLNYIIMPHLMGINITKYVQIQFGGQVAILLNAKADSSKMQATNNPYGKIMDYYNRFDYGAAAGIEICPFKGFIIGGRYNISFGDLYKDAMNPTPGTTPSFIPKVDTKNNVVQFFAGYKF